MIASRARILLALAALFMLVVGAVPTRAASFDPDATELSYSDLIARGAAKQVRDVTIRGNLAFGELSDGRSFRTYLPNDRTTVDRLLADGVTVRAEPDVGKPVIAFLLNLIPVLLLWVVILHFGRNIRPRGAGGIGTEFGRTRAREARTTMHRVTFAEVAGVDEARQELEEIVQFLREPGRFQELGGKIPAGVLLIGPPGTGKTLLARAIAGEAGVPFFSVSGSDFVEMFVGVGASRMRDTFARARQQAPCIVFIDEIDAVGRRRGAGRGGGSDEREQTLNQLLVEMDGIEGNRGVIVIAATNRPEILDAALLRPGRFDRQVILEAPDFAGRERILAVHLRKVPTEKAIDLAAIAGSTHGLSGAGLANLVNEAALLAARRGRLQVGMAELEAARDKVVMGPERRSLAVAQEERRRTAYHEAGHALVAIAMEGNARLHKATIVPRGKALGMTLSLPGRDSLGASKAEMRARIAVMFGGRIAEELVYGKRGVTTGAADDLRQAASLARRMVTEFGFSDQIGPLCLADRTGEAASCAGFSDATAEVVDREIRRIVEDGERAARKALTERLDGLHRVAAALLERETLSGEELAFCAAAA